MAQMTREMVTTTNDAHTPDNPTSHWRASRRQCVEHGIHGGAAVADLRASIAAHDHEFSA